MTIHARTVVADGLTPVAAYAALRAADPEGASFLFESVEAGQRWGRLSILGYRPRYELVLRRGRWTAHARRAGVEPPRVDAATGDPFAPLEPLFRTAAPPADVPEHARLASAHVGFFAWDVVHALERVPPPPGLAEADEPAARFLGGSVTIVFDQLRQTMTVLAADARDVDHAIEDLRAAPPLRTIAPPDRGRLPDGVVEELDDEAFGRLVLRSKEFIASGDVFQLVLGRKFTVPREGRDPFDVYRAMRLLNPSPYMYFLDLPALEGETGRLRIAGASPETMVRLEDGTVTVRPIAGTRPRGATDAEDARLEAELAADPKERAEHVMLIDLGRNDVGRVAEIGSVRLSRTMELERYSHVIHIVSEVQGRVRAGTPPLDVLRAAFPAGTLSGAPKVRAMQIISELEGRPRGLYGGAIGYATSDGSLDFAIAIRTAVCRGESFVVTAGAGLVDDSDPRAEAQETRNKARAVLCAIEAAPRR